MGAEGGQQRDHFNLYPHAGCMFVCESVILRDRAGGKDGRMDGGVGRDLPHRSEPGFPDTLQMQSGHLPGGLAGVHINIFRIEHLSEIREADYFTLSAPTEGCTFYWELLCCRQEM